MNKNILRIIGLEKSFGRKKVLKSINLDLKRGEVVGLLGINGAGKTTLLKSIMGFLNLTNGKIIYDGEDIKTKSNFVKELGVLLNPSFFDYMTVYENLEYLMKLSGESNKHNIDKEIKELLAFVDLAPNIKDKVQTFSFGMKQRLGLAQAMIGNPKILMLDEPFVGLDPNGRKIIKDKIRELAEKKGVTIIFSSHQLYDVQEICDRVVMIHEGEIKINDSRENIENNREVTIKIEGTLEKKYLENIKNVSYCEENNIVKIKTGMDDRLHEVISLLIKQGLKIKSLNVSNNILFEMFESVQGEGIDV